MAGMGKTFRGHGFQSYTRGFTETRSATGIVRTVFAYAVKCTFGRCRLSEENVDGLLFLHGLKMRK